MPGTGPVFKFYFYLIAARITSENGDVKMGT